MTILVTGAGGVGGYFGGVLARGGEDVTFLARSQHLDAINRHGLKIESVSDGEFTVHAPAVEQPDGSWAADLVLLCVKSYHNEGAMEAMGPAVGDDTTILTLQNGVGSGDQLAGAFGRDKVLLGVAYIEAARRRRASSPSWAASAASSSARRTAPSRRGPSPSAICYSGRAWTWSSPPMSFRRSGTSSS